MNKSRGMDSFWSRSRPLKCRFKRFVYSFVDRYIPGYHFFGRGVDKGGFDQGTDSYIIPPWLQDEPQPPSCKNPPARCLRMIIDENRNLSKVEYCRRQ